MKLFDDDIYSFGLLFLYRSTEGFVTLIRSQNNMEIVLQRMNSDIPFLYGLRF